MADKNREEQETEVEIIKAVRGAADTPVLPVRLGPQDRFCFSCHKDVPCWNACCHGADVMLTPYDILRMSKHLGIRPSEFLLEYAVPDIWDKGNLPVAKLKMGGKDGQGACSFMADEGCTIYEDRPATCRYYPLGLATVKMKGQDEKEDFHFLVKETLQLRRICNLYLRVYLRVLHFQGGINKRNLCFAVNLILIRVHGLPVNLPHHVFP